MKKPVMLICLITVFTLGCDGDKQSVQTPSPVADETVTSVSDPMQNSLQDAVTPEVETTPADEPVVEEQPVVQLMSGEQVFKKHCFACHMTGAANAPKVGDADAWAPRIAKGMEALVLSAINGVPNTAMTAKGTCYACTEEELQAAIDFMVNQSM